MQCQTPRIPQVWGTWGDLGGLPTSSSLKAIMETARKTASVEPVIVVMRSGQDPSEIVMRALLWGQCHTPLGMSQALCFMTSPRESIMGEIDAFEPEPRPSHLPQATFPGVLLCFPWFHLGFRGAGTRGPSRTGVTGSRT